MSVLTSHGSSSRRSAVFQIHPWARDLFERLGLRSLDDVVERFGLHDSGHGKRVTVRHVRLERPGGSSLDIHYKEYAYVPASWKFATRQSKAQREFHNYEALHSIGLRTAQPIAFGERRSKTHCLQLAFIITRTVPNAVTLREFLDPQNNPHPSQAALAQRASLLAQLADGVRQMHAAGFFHNDLVARNLLVTTEPDGNPTLWWIDCPRGRFSRFSPFRRRHRLKDLALLDKTLTVLCTGGERLAFLQRYLNTSSHDPRVQDLARAVVSYVRNRWPDKPPHTPPEDPNMNESTIGQHCETRS